MQIEIDEQHPPWPNCRKKNIIAKQQCHSNDFSLTLSLSTAVPTWGIKTVGELRLGNKNTSWKWVKGPRRSENKNEKKKKRDGFGLRSAVIWKTKKYRETAMTLGRIWVEVRRPLLSENENRKKKSYLYRVTPPLK